MRNTYGYIRGTEGVDGDHIDVFLTNDIDGWNGRRVYIVDQYNEDDTFDEHKVMLGFNDEAEAQDAYLSNYEKGWEYKHKLVMSSVNLPDFEKWINSSHRKTKPFAEYKSVKVEGTQSEESNALQNQKQKRYRLLQSFVSTKDGRLKKKYADTFKNPVYAVFDSNNPNSEPFYITSSPRDALNAAFNYDIENFDVLYVNATEKKIELGAYSLLAYGQDASYDSDGAFREEIKQRLAEDIGKLGPTRLKESNIKNGNDYFPGSGKMNREQEEAEKSESRSAVSQEMDENGHPFILASDGTSTFGNITEETGLAAAPIKLSEGFQSEDGKGYGLAHIEYRHGEQIRNAGFPSVEKFVEDVAKNFTVIKRGNARGESETYLLEVQDAHNNTLFVELSKDGSYWNVNSAGVFKKGYSKKKDIVWTVPALGSSTNADATEVHHGQSKGETVTSGNSSQTISSKDKGSDSSSNSQTSSGFIARTLDDFKADRESVVQSTVEDLKDEYATANLSKTDEEIRKEAEELVDYNEEADLYMEVWDRLENLTGPEYMDKLETDARKNGEDRLSLATMIEEIERRENRVQEEAEKIQQQSGPVEKIEDIGEKIGGAKKDRFKEFIEREKQLQEKPDSFMEELRKLPVSKIFNFNLEALRKDGLSNEAATLIDVIRRVIPSKPRTDWKLKRWVSDVFGLYRFCLTLATAEQGTFDQILRKATFIRNIGGMYRAQMALGGFDSGLDTGQATLEELGEGAGHYDKDDNWVSIKGQWYVTHAGRYGGIYPDYEKAKEALTQFAGENSKGKEKGTEVKFSIYSYKHSGEAFITPKGKPGIVVESGFKSRKEALDYLNEHMGELQAKYRNMKDATSIGFAPNGERRGKDWRGGKDVTAEDFRNTFGFRGVEFGNWANQQERQLALNQAYDAFMDLSEATGISPQGLSLGGELGMAFGARGGGGAAAHYEPGKVVINLTKTQGAGTLAHEWWHAIDNYFSRRRGQALGYNTERKGYNLPVRGGKVEREHEAERKEITNAFTALMKAINGSSYGERSNAYANLKSSYWKEPTELGARAFAVWVERKLSEKGIVNNFLANNNVIGWESPELTQKYYPYPLESDFESLDVAFDNLFGAIEEKVDEETGNTVLYRFIGEQGASRLDAAEEATTRMDNLAIARKMEEEGKNAWAIKWATGWERGADRKWRYETPDFEYTPPENFEEGKNYNLSDIIKDNELFTAYPKLRGLKFRLENLPDEYGGGWFGGNEIVINTAYNNPSRYESTIAHEIQHAIQAEEGFEKGDDPDDVIDRYLNAQYEIGTADIHTLDVAAFIRKRAERLIKKGKYKYMRWAIRSAMGPLRGRNDMYSEYGPIETLTVYHTAKELKDAYEKAYQAGESIFVGMPSQKDAVAAYLRNAGETEARNVERRLQLTPEKRRETMAWETEDVSRRDQLFINSALRGTASYAPAAEDISLVNERFNEALSGLTEENASSTRLQLGRPSNILLSTGIPNKPLILYGNKLIKKSKKHGFSPKDIKDLPLAMQSPIAVFVGSHPNSFAVLSEMEINGKNVLVSIETEKDGEIDFNIISSVFGKNSKGVIKWMLDGKLRYVDKEKALSYISASAPIADATYKKELSDATKIVENFENPIIEEEILRSGEGFLSDDALSVANDPMSKFLGKSPRTARQRRAFAERERRNMANRVQELAEKLHLDNVEIVNEPMVVTDKKGKTHYPKGFYNRATDKITIVIPNNVNTFDAEQTLLHEAVAHYGLRRLFGEHFDTFLDNVFNNADVEVRRKIVALAQKNGWDTRLATEEYLASLAEDTNFDDLNASWWRKIKDLFLRMLHKIGFEGFDGVTLSDNELRYILWRSYENLREPGRYRSILGQAEDIAKQYELKVGNYAPTISNIGQVAESKDAAKAERIRKLRESKPVEITGNEIEPSDDLKQYKKNALEYGKKLRGEYTNKDTGETISLTGGNSRGGIREILQHDYKDVEHLQSIAAIPQIIENSIFIDELPNEDFDKYPGVSSFSYYVCGLKIGKEDYTVKAIIANQSNGERYYDHKLTHIEKGKLLSIVPTIQKAGMEGNSPLSGIKDKRLLSILQDNADENLLFRTGEDKTGDVVKQFKSQVRNTPDIATVRTEGDVDALPYDRLTKEAVRMRLRNKATSGAYDKENNVIFIFPEAARDAAEMEDTLWHETAHYASRGLRLTNGQKNACLEYLRKNYPKKYGEITHWYRQDKWGEEAVAYLFEITRRKYGTERLLNSTFAGNSDIANVFTNIINFLRNGKESNRLQSSDGNGRGQLGDGAPNGTESQGGERMGRVRGMEDDGTRSSGRGTDEGVRSLDERKSDDVSPSPISTPTVEAWDKLANSFKFHLRETAVDHLTAVEIFQELIAKHSGKAIQSYENTYDMMLALSSKNKEEMDRFDSFIVKPMNKAILQLTGEKERIKKWKWDEGPLRELVMYVEAKHGTERNRQMAVEELAKDDKSGDSILKDWNEAKKDINALQLSWEEKQRRLDQAAMNLGADLSQDYSGLSSVFKDKEKYPEGWQEASRKYVSQYEANHNTGHVDDLWKAISNATDYSLRKQYEAGLVSKEYVERQHERFDHYIPLRGFADEVAGDVYNYMGNDFYPGGNPVKTAGGRTSEAGNPFGSILNIAYSSIAVGNKNMAKLALYSLVVNHGTGGLAITNRAWMVKYDELKNNKELGNVLVTPEISGDEETPEWVEAVPKMPEKATAEEITQVMNRFEEVMSKYQQADVTKPVSRKAKTAYRTLYNERSQHEIPLFIAGDKYVITVTGNPRLAQAMNGLLNPDVNNDPFTELGKRVQRFMAGAFTAKNVAFAFANLFKDTMYANNQAFIRENPRYWLKFTANQRLGVADFPLMMRRLYKYREGTLDMNNKTERLFKEFMDNGGATGYTFINSQDEYSKELARKLEDLSKGKAKWFTPKAMGTMLFDLIEFAGQSAELVNRFAAYRTSREMGRSVSRSVREAKEITVNFNRKGAGRKSADKDKSWYSTINIASAISQYGRAHILFWNANMQSKYRFYKNLTEHPVKTGITLVANCMAIGGIAIPFLNNMLLPALYDAMSLSSGDDDEDYYDVLTDWERTHNICVRLPYGNWLKIPLSPEMTPWYSMGDSIFGAASGKRDVSASDFIKSTIDVVSPLSINWSYEGSMLGLNLLPTVTQPVMQIMMNVNFMGNPLHKTPFSTKQGFKPQYEMVYNNASPTLVELSRMSNILTGGSDMKTSGWADWNPANLQNLISGYTGGWGTTILSVADWIVSTSKGEKQAVTFSRMPFVSRFVISGNKDVRLRRINSSFYKVRDFINEFEYDRKSYIDAIRDARKKGDILDMAEHQEKLNRLLNGDRSYKYIRLKEIDDAAKTYEDYLEDMPDDKTTRNLLYGIKMRGIEVLRE